ncbi:hypothetical protein V5N11_016974 [Cardamine amara subsp. amara]|uniref:RNase H type-1 domain-containing protein n=1 Tax=Cardamine amara subsp. amara TaxID=228776 RepID=A0ABD1B8D4_CARAN
MDSVDKVKDDRDLWFPAHLVTEHMEREEATDEVISEEIWKPPYSGFYKCNVGGIWDKKKSIGGCAWVLRDEHGRVLLHSRRSFANLKSKEDVMIHSFLWSIESMADLHFSNVVFAIEALDLIKAVNKPGEWPAFTNQSDRLLSALEPIIGWKCLYEYPAANRGADLFAQSAIRVVFSQSYLALSFPEWLRYLFESEMVHSSF